MQIISMVKIIVVVVFFVLLSLILFVLFQQKKGLGRTTQISVSSLTPRPVITSYLDDLSESDILSTMHTTRNLEEPEKRIPSPPKEFESGDYAVTFLNTNTNNKMVLMFKMEEKVGHLAVVIPGKTNIGRHVEIQITEKNGLISPTLNDSEIDYLLKILYKKFEKPLTATQAKNINQVKDYALAMLFSGKSGIADYHTTLLSTLKP